MRSYTPHVGEGGRADVVDLLKISGKSKCTGRKYTSGIRIYEYVDGSTPPVLQHMRNVVSQ